MNIVFVSKTTTELLEEVAGYVANLARGENVRAGRSIGREKKDHQARAQVLERLHMDLKNAQVQK